MQCLKKDAPVDVVAGLRLIEERADACFQSLEILKMPSNVAAWALLVGGIKLVEKEIAAHGDNTPELTATLLNVSRIIPVAMRWVVEHGRRASKIAARRWSDRLDAQVEQALSTAHHYGAFLSCFPMWHKNRYVAELISPTLVRFTAFGTAKDRQVSAYLKSIRPKEGTYAGQRAKKVEQTPRVQQLFSNVFQDCKKAGLMRFEYADPWELWLELLPEYSTRVGALVRRADSLSLGDYKLGDFKRFYAALLAICAAHEFLCFTWERNHGLYPSDSAVLIRPVARWTALLSELSGVPSLTCQNVLRDLTFDSARSLDLHIHPFVPLGYPATHLAVAPQFPLHSRLDENILRVCSMVRRDVFDAASLEKEAEILAALRGVCARYSPQGPISLPKPNPDIDFLLSEESSSTVVIAEVKWIRKTGRPVEHMDRDADVLKGMKQLRQIRDFLNGNPTHLRAVGKLPKGLNEYKNIYYLLIARDHWLWIEPTNDTAIVEFDALSAAMSRCDGLQSTINNLLKYEWLPVEGRDFHVQYDRGIVNGVSLESEVFYSL